MQSNQLRQVSNKKLPVFLTVLAAIGSTLAASTFFKTARAGRLVDIIIESIRKVEYKLLYSIHIIEVSVINNSQTELTLNYPAIQAYLGTSNIGVSQPNNIQITVGPQSSKKFPIEFRIDHSQAIMQRINGNIDLRVVVTTAVNGINTTKEATYKLI